ncbi:MAG: NAD(P)H-dependent oxidoreductase [Arenibacterium sp.]
MHVLVVLDHPNPNSFSHALAAAFMEGALATGHSAELGDLHAEGFNPLWSMADIEAEEGSEALADVLAEQARIERSDAIALVFPLFWWGMPSMMKGWVDRVWRWGWAYDQLEDPELSMQKPRTGILLVAAGARSDEMEREGYTTALETAWTKGTFGYFGFSPRRIELLCGTQGSGQRRADLLKRSYEIGRNLPAPEKTGRLRKA